MATFRIKTEVQVSGFTSVYNKTVEITGEATATADPTVAAAKTGTLTVRTSASVGSLTMTSGHGIATADVFDLFWSGGARHGVVAGTVAGDVVPISGGAGDDLPDAATAITANEGTSQSMPCDGTSAQAISVYSDTPAYVSFRDAGDAEVFAVRLINPTNPLLGYSYDWYSGSGVDNPLDGETIASVKCTHGDSVTTHKPQVAVVVS